MGPESESSDENSAGAASRANAACLARSYRSFCPASRVISAATRPLIEVPRCAASTLTLAMTSSSSWTVTFRFMSTVHRVDHSIYVELSSTSASKQVRSPVWHAAPVWSTTTSSVSPSQSSRTSRTCCTCPEVSPLTQ